MYTLCVHVGLCMYACTHVCVSLSCLSECKVKTFTLVCGSIIIHVYSYLGHGDAMPNTSRPLKCMVIATW